MKIVIQCDTTEEEQESIEVEEWIRDGEFESHIDITVEGPAG